MNINDIRDTTKEERIAFLLRLLDLEREYDDRKRKLMFLECLRDFKEGNIK